MNGSGSGEGKRLDEHQMKAVTTTAPKVLVVAGPGSGKTTVMVARVVHMVGQLKILASQVVTITFTRYAARQLRERIPAAYRPGFVGTLHAFCLKLLMDHGAVLGYQRDTLTILADEEATLDEREALVGAGLVKKLATGGISWTAVTQRDWKAYLDGILQGRHGPDVIPALAPAFTAFVARMRAQNTLTYGLMMLETLQLMEDAQALKSIRRSHAHFLVDEFQDTDHAQWGVLLRILGKLNPRTVYAVGDADQSIYQWRGASPGIMVQMAKQPGTEVIHLVNCYRYGAGIADPAARLIQRNAERIQHQVVPMGKARGEASRLEGLDIVTTAKLVKMQAEDVGAGYVAVLCRTHAPLQQLKEVLDRMDVPAVKLGRMADLHKTAEFRTCVALLRLTYHPGNWQAFMAITATLGLDARAILVLREYALGERCSLLEAYRRQPGHHSLPTGLNTLAGFLAAVDPSGEYGQAVQFLTHLNALEGFQTTQDLVNFLAGASIQDEIQDKPAVTLGTIHAAKGLEWPVVIVMGMCQGITPGTRGRLEEERRLIYVAMTRAQRRLFMVHNVMGPDEEPVRGRPRAQLALNMGPGPSQFLDETGLPSGNE